MYEIYYKDNLAFSIGSEKSEQGIVKIHNEKYLPFDIYLEESEDIDDRINNVVNFNSWCSGRILPLDREYSKEILNYYGFTQRLTDSERAKIAIATRCLSLNDCFWLKSDKEHIMWKDVNLFDNSLENAVFEVALFGKTPTVTNTELITPDISTDGKAPKAWMRQGKDFYLFKADKNNSVIKETEASEILGLLGIGNAGYGKSEFDGQPVSKSKCFTNEYVNLVKAEWFSIWCMNHDENIADYIYRYKDQFDKMNLADYLIGNNDEHPQNWGFLYDNGMNILSLNPPMDYDHAFESSPSSVCLPARFLGMNITQEDMAVSIMKEHPQWLTIKDTDLSKFSYGGFVKERLDLLLKKLGYDDRYMIDIKEQDEPQEEYEK